MFIKGKKQKMKCKIMKIESNHFSHKMPVFYGMIFK